MDALLSESNIYPVVNFSFISQMEDICNSMAFEDFLELVNFSTI